MICATRSGSARAIAGVRRGLVPRSRSRAARRRRRTRRRRAPPAGRGRRPRRGSRSRRRRASRGRAGRWSASSAGRPARASCARTRARRVVGLLVLEQLDEAAEREDRRAQLVRGVGDELLAGAVEPREPPLHLVEGQRELADLVGGVDRDRRPRSRPRRPARRRARAGAAAASAPAREEPGEQRRSRSRSRPRSGSGGGSAPRCPRPRRAGREHRDPARLAAALERDRRLARCARRPPSRPPSCAAPRRRRVRGRSTRGSIASSSNCESPTTKAGCELPGRTPSRVTRASVAGRRRGRAAAARACETPASHRARQLGRLLGGRGLEPLEPLGGQARRSCGTT